MRIVTILTDFGTEDYFVGAMKGVLLTRNPGVALVDITHAIPPHDVRAAAFALNAAFRYFPPGSIHLAVVDPGVGSERRPLVVEAAGHAFVGPDNGLFSLVLDQDPAAGVRHVTGSEHFLPNPSSTFHGRDIFAPVAAALSLGVPPARLGPLIEDPVRLQSAYSVVGPDGTMHGAVIAIDHFGNCVTNLPGSAIPTPEPGRFPRLMFAGREIDRHVKFYAEASDQPDRPFMIVGSSGFLEVSLWCASAARRLGITVGEPVSLIIP